jgi:hypothetical protein
MLGQAKSPFIKLVTELKAGAVIEIDRTLEVG